MRNSIRMGSFAGKSRQTVPIVLRDTDPVSTGPNLIPWCEMVYYHQFGDVERLHKIFPVLCAYYKWLRLNRTWRNGTYWSSGWGTGMDNMPRVESKYNPIYSHGHMIWLDTNLQQLFTANLLLEMGFYLERWQEIEELEDEIQVLKNTSAKICGTIRPGSCTISMPMAHWEKQRESVLSGRFIPMC